MKKPLLLPRINRPKQSGFTLIELMVVLVIVGVLLSATVISIKPSESGKMRKQTAAFKGLMQAVCDQSAFDQHIYVMMPTEKGIDVSYLSKQKWTAVERFNKFQWVDGIEVDWQLSAEQAKKDKLPAPGWMCWPSGEIKKGQITFQFDSLKETVRWNSLRQFIEPNPDEEDDDYDAEDDRF